MRHYQASLIRHTDRRPVTTEPVDPAALTDVIETVQAEGAWLHILRPEQIVELAATVDRAMHDEGMDDNQRAEQTRWVGGTRPECTGIPDTVIPRQAPQTTVPGRDFGLNGTLPVSAGHDTAAVYAVLYGPGDTNVDWLRAGEALSAGWLDAVDHGLAVGVELDLELEVSVRTGEPPAGRRPAVTRDDRPERDRTPARLGGPDGAVECRAVERLGEIDIRRPRGARAGQFRDHSFRDRGQVG
jgi:hypothetical protein